MAFYKLLLCVATLFMLAASKSSERPNIIFFFLDDLGYGDLGFQSNDQILTPNIDKLVSEGQFLEYHYGQLTCSPSRASFLTGVYPLHSGINVAIKEDAVYGVPLKYRFLGDMLLEVGYKTHAIGKWHLGYYQWGYTPTFRGFESWLGYYSGGEDYFSHKSTEGNQWYDMTDAIGLNCGEDCSTIYTQDLDVYSTYIYTDRAIEVIKNHTADYPDKPLFLYVAYQAVHIPVEAPSTYTDPYSDSIEDETRRTFAGMLAAADESIGNITAVLQENGYLDSNTVIIFSSDNGGQSHPTMGGAQYGGSSNWPLRGGKGTIYEGGERLTAGLWATEDLVPRRVRGTNYTNLMHLVDWYPTICAMAGVDYTYYINYSIDGVNQWDGLTRSVELNDSYFQFRDTLWYGSSHAYTDTKPGCCPIDYVNTGMRWEWWKIINGTGGRWADRYPTVNCTHDVCGENVPKAKGKETQNVHDFKSYHLYDLQSDPTESNDVATDNPSIVKQMITMMEEMESDGVAQQVDDESCPEQTPGSNSVVGDTTIPWC